MKELSVFIDESGDFGEYDDQAPYYIIMKKRLLTCFLFIVLLTSVGISHADTFWKLHWKPGEYVVEFTLEEETKIAGIIKMANEKSEGTNEVVKFS